MDKERINYLKAEMRKITDAFNLKLTVKCVECNSTYQIDYFDYFSKIIITCSICKAKFSLGAITDPLEDLPWYKKKFIDGHFKIIQQLTIVGVDFSQDITNEQEDLFDYNWDFANGVVDLYTSFETFLYELLCKNLEEFVYSGKKINRNNPKFEGNSNILNLLDKINSGKIVDANMILEEIEGSFKVKDCSIVLEVIGGINKKDLESCYDIQTMRNGIVHRGNQANFEDYAKTFITIGKIFDTYKFD